MRNCGVDKGIVFHIFSKFFSWFSPVFSFFHSILNNLSVENVEFIKIKLLGSEIRLVQKRALQVTKKIPHTNDQGVK